MTRRFHIWSQNLNPTSFDPIFGPKTVKNRNLSVFDSFCVQKGGQMLFDIIFAIRFKILSSFPVYITRFVKIIKL